MMGSEVTRDGLEHVRPGREAVTGGTDRTHDIAADDEFASYYGQPVIRRPGWSEVDIVGYLFLGGLAGGSSILALVDDHLGADRASSLARFTAAGSALASLGLLVHDLGRPERFINMLRVVKPTSPMNMGSWLLAAYVPSTLVAAAGPRIGLLRRLVRPAGWAAAVLGSAVTAYTAVLLADTAVPAWHEAGDELPFVFIGSSAMAAGGVAMATAPSAEAAAARRFGAAGAIIDLIADERLRRTAGVVRPAHDRGAAGLTMRISRVLAIGGALAAVLGDRRPGLRRVGGLALVAASALTRVGVFRAGLASADDPRFVVESQRRRLDAGP